MIGLPFITRLNLIECLYKTAINSDTKNMLIVFTRAIIIYLCLLFAMRLMGKKQLGELQPFEFAITLVAAELACNLITIGRANTPKIKVDIIEEMHTLPKMLSC